MSKKLIWFRNDLRTTDHLGLHHCESEQHQVIGVYCLSPNLLETNPLGFANAGPYRLQFLFESIACLQKNMKALGSDLLFYIAKPDDILPKICKELEIAEVMFEDLPGTQEIQEARLVQTELKKLGIGTQSYWDCTLSALDQMPFSLENLPDLFTTFKNRVEPKLHPRASVPQPKSVMGIEHTLLQQPFPEIKTTTEASQTNNWFSIKGGEKEALLRLREYTWQSHYIQSYKLTRNGLIGKDYSSKLSAYLALGCISPSKVYEEVKAYEKLVLANESTYWLIFELLWRDYFKWVLLKYGNKLFLINGIGSNRPTFKNNSKWFNKWRMGETGQDFIDANMRELLHTGFMSNRGRQNAANYLCKTLGINWLWGAAWFESQLIDYDVASNYGNWAYQAGVGNDARADRKFNPEKQANDYDPNQNYVNFWLGQ